jgi:hypothetical protein
MNTETKDAMTDRNTPWIAMSKRRPTAEDFDGESFVRLYARVATTSSTTNHYSLGCFNETASYYPATDAYWFPVKIPPPPKPVASQREEDNVDAREFVFKNSDITQQSGNYGVFCYLAGMYAERKQIVKLIPDYKDHQVSARTPNWNKLRARLDEQGEGGGK